MKTFGIVVALLMVWISGVYAVSVGSTSDPNKFVIGDGELLPQTGNVWKNTQGYTQTSSLLSAPSTSAVVITTWQSLAANSATGTSTVTNTGRVFNLNINDGALYQCKNPVLGTTYDNVNNPANSNNINCIIGDTLVTNAVYTDVVMMSVAVGGTLCSDWTGVISKRISSAISRLAALKLTTASGFTGQVWVLPHGGETDNNAATPRATLAQCIRDFSALWAGLGTYRFFVPTESMNAGVTSATVTGAQADAVASGCANCRAGQNVDSIASGSRQADGIHMTQASNATLASGDVTVITNCKNTAC